MTFYKTVFAIVFLCFFVTQANAASECTKGNFPTTPIEFARLPPYCSAKMKAAGGGPETAAWKHWENKLGRENFIHIHHYCSALNGLNRAYTEQEPCKSRTLKVALGGIDYVQERATNNFYLLPELHQKKGEIYTLLKNYTNAINELNIAINLNEKYTPSYYFLANIYLQLENKEKAIETLKSGLKVNPNSKLIKKKLSKIK